MKYAILKLIVHYKFVFMLKSKIFSFRVYFKVTIRYCKINKKKFRLFIRHAICRQIIHCVKSSMTSNHFGSIIIYSYHEFVKYNFFIIELKPNLNETIFALIIHTNKCVDHPTSSTLNHSDQVATFHSLSPWKGFR